MVKLFNDRYFWDIYMAVLILASFGYPFYREHTRPYVQLEDFGLYPWCLGAFFLGWWYKEHVPLLREAFRFGGAATRMFIAVFTFPLTLSRASAMNYGRGTAWFIEGHSGPSTHPKHLKPLFKLSGACAWGRPWPSVDARLTRVAAGKERLVENTYFHRLMRALHVAKKVETIIFDSTGLPMFCMRYKHEALSLWAKPTVKFYAVTSNEDGDPICDKSEELFRVVRLSPHLPFLTSYEGHNDHCESPFCRS